MFPARRFSSAIASYEYTFPVVRTAAIFVYAVNSLYSTGQWYRPAAFLWKCSTVSPSRPSLCPVAGSTPYRRTKPSTALSSYTMPSRVHTGVLNGTSVSAQQSNGTTTAAAASLRFFSPP